MNGEDCEVAVGVLIVVLVSGHSAMDADTTQSLLLIYPVFFEAKVEDITSDTEDSAPT